MRGIILYCFLSPLAYLQNVLGTVHCFKKNVEEQFESGMWVEQCLLHSAPLHTVAVTSVRLLYARYCCTTFTPVLMATRQQR
jgi:hypothetical protein